MARLLDPRDKVTGEFPFEWRSAIKTDVRITWAKALDEMKQKQRENDAEIKAKVRVFGKVVKP